MTARCADDRERLRLERPGLQVLDDPCLNAQASLEQLDEVITPARSFFVRNNGNLPLAASDRLGWSIEITGEVKKPSSFTVADLRARFAYHEIVSVLECAGNGRAMFEPRTEGLQWGLGAVGCARWGGVRLAEILQDVEVTSKAVYTGHFSPDVKIGTSEPAISRGIPIDKALAPETLLAFSMNGEALPHLNGGPLRVVVPGYPGSAWQKWLTGIVLRDREHDGEKMRGTDYRLPRTPVKPGAPLDPANFHVITDILPRSLVTQIHRQDDFCRLSGKAWAGASGIDKVEYSLDTGRTWRACQLSPEVHRFAWRLFQCDLPGSTRGKVVIRAWDRTGRVQPTGSATWNPRGYCNNVAQVIALT